jgi:hypothetical protein
MNGPVNIRTLKAGTRVVLSTGQEAEITANPEDGVWLFVRLPDSDEEMIFAQDVVEVLG